MFILKKMFSICRTVLLSRDIRVKDNTLEQLISTYQSKTLFIIDGIDNDRRPDASINSGFYSDVQELISAKLYNNTNLLSLALPSVADSSLRYFDMAYRLMGFSSLINQLSFVSKFSNEISSSQTLTSAVLFEHIVSENTIVQTLGKNPLFLSILCLLWLENQQLACDDSTLCNTRTELLRAFMEFVIRRTSLHECLVESECQMLFQQLCKLAFTFCKQSNSLVTSMEENIIEEELSMDVKPLLKLGLLCCFPVIKPKLHQPVKQYQFVQSVFQHFLAAFYVMSCSVEELYIILKDQDYCDLMYVFTCGLLRDNPMKLAVVFECVLECQNRTHKKINVQRKSSKTQHEQRQHLALECINECGPHVLPLSLSSKVIPDKFYYNATTCCYCLEGFISALSDDIPTKENTHLPDIIIDGGDVAVCRSTLFNEDISDINNTIQIHGVVIEDCFSPFVLLMLLNSFLLSTKWYFQHLYISCRSTMTSENIMYPINQASINDVVAGAGNAKNTGSVQDKMKSLLFEGSACVKCRGSTNITEALNRAVELSLASSSSSLQVCHNKCFQFYAKIILIPHTQ